MDSSSATDNTLGDQAPHERTFDEALMECARFMGVEWPLPPTHDLATLMDNTYDPAPCQTAPMFQLLIANDAPRGATCDDNLYFGNDTADRVEHKNNQDGDPARAIRDDGDGSGNGRDNAGGRGNGHAHAVSTLDTGDTNDVIILGESAGAGPHQRRRKRVEVNDTNVGLTSHYADDNHNHKRLCIRSTQPNSGPDSTDSEGDDDGPSSDYVNKNGPCFHGGCKTRRSFMCTHGMCAVHCRARQRLLGPTHGRCASVLHSVVVWMERCAVAGCRGRTSVGCRSRLCTRHCVALTPAAATCDNTPHHKAIRKSRCAVVIR
ncbi:hypothetical protein pclt_cds_825 [Pandoravirus celtis]|uniref:Uncharacterized protein n=1 Tax=Pandoravirus celtis TaxID=2568002 RepID=A0A4D6EJ13_9VIRU|nr:hypothetical protein pclt_cds_825 [Pandoravirus celtis]